MAQTAKFTFYEKQYVLLNKPWVVRKVLPQQGKGLLHLVRSDKAFDCL
ncbi:MAG: hypothetical protein IPN76_19560 [Saprospiraceae bacterium]|nr:hypothetical protein [Saprospiraceae bacterium]